MSSPPKSPRSRANYSDEKKEELRRINRERARQRRAHMTEEEKQAVRLRQRVNTRKKREAARQKQKEENQSPTNFSKRTGNQNQGTAMSSSSSMHPGTGLSIPHPQAAFAHSQPHSNPMAQSRSHHPQNQPQPQPQSHGIPGQWNMGNLMASSQGQMPGPYQRPGPIHPNNLLLSPQQTGYPQQRYDTNDFNDRAQMQGQLKMTMGVLEDCVRRLSALEKDVQDWKGRFEAEVESRRTIEEWVLGKFGVDLRIRFSTGMATAPATKPKLSNGRGKKRKKATATVNDSNSANTNTTNTTPQVGVNTNTNERFMVNHHESPPKIPPSATATCEGSLWPLDAETVQNALNLDGVGYNSLNTMTHHIPPFNAIKEEVASLYSPTINSNSSIISYK